MLERALCDRAGAVRLILVGLELRALRKLFVASKLQPLWERDVGSGLLAVRELASAA